MCIANYRADIVETRHSHTYPDTAEDILRNKVFRAKLGIDEHAPGWLEWRVISSPHGRTKRGYIRASRNRMNRELKNAIARGMGFEDFHIESRADRIDGRSWWY